MRNAGTVAFLAGMIGTAVGVLVGANTLSLALGLPIRPLGNFVLFVSGLILGVVPGSGFGLVVSRVQPSSDARFWIIVTFVTSALLGAAGGRWFIWQLVSRIT
jgi:hypothetical protein